MARADAARMLDRSSPLPLWAQLHQDLLRRLGAGAFHDGFPGELELQQTYEVSRHTVREALRRIRDAGLIDSARGRATRVSTATIEQPLGGLYSLFREVEAQGLVQRSTVVSMDMRTDEVAAAELGRPATDPLFYLERVRFAGDEPLAHDRVWLPAELGRPLLTADFSRAALYDELTKRSGIRPNGGSERIVAVVPSPAERALLAVPRGLACFAIERIGCVRQEPVEYRQSLVRADRYALLTRWTPAGYSVGASATAGPDSTRRR